MTQSGTNNTFQGANGSGPGSLVQSGSGNHANVTQSGVASTVTLSQTGKKNGVFNQNKSLQFTPNTPISAK